MEQEPQKPPNSQENNSKTTQQERGSTEKTARRLAFFLILIYFVALAIIGIVAAVASLVPILGADVSQPWIDLFKSGFLILGGALSTVVGYYFGSRGIQEAEERAAESLVEAKREAEEAENRAKAARTIEDEANRRVEALTAEAEEARRNLEVLRQEYVAYEEDAPQELPYNEGGLLLPEDYEEMEQRNGN